MLLVGEGAGAPQPQLVTMSTQVKSESSESQRSSERQSSSSSGAEPPDGEDNRSPEARAYHLVRHVQREGKLNGVKPEDCGPFADEAETLITAFRQHDADHARKVLKELDGLRGLLNSFDPETEGPHPLADLDGMTAADLLRQDFDPPEYVVEGVIPEGVTLLASPPKIGKTFLCLNVALAVATGGKALGKADVKEGRVLYVDLDGSKRGAQSRLEEMLDEIDEAENLEDLTRFDYYSEFPRVDDEDPADAMAYLRHYLERFDNVELVIFDTLADVRPKTSGTRNMYEVDREALTPFRDLVHEFDTSAVFVHHTNKGKHGDHVKRVSGSSGLASAVDNIIIMQKERGQHDAELQVTPREEEERTLRLTFDEYVLTWRLEGPAGQFAKTAERQAILDALRELTDNGEGDPVGPKRVADELPDTKPENVRALLKKMVEAEEPRVEKVGYGEYKPTPQMEPRSHRSHRSHSPDSDTPF